MSWNLDGITGTYTWTDDTDSDNTLSDADEVGVRDGRAGLVRNAECFGATDGNTQLYLPLDEGAASANPLDISGLAWAGSITNNDGANNWRVIGGTPAFVPENARRYGLSNFIPAPASGTTFTFECVSWSNSGKPTVRETLLGYNHATNKVYIWRETNGRVLGYCIGPGGTAFAQIATTDPLGDGQLHHLRLVIKEKDVKLFLDGVVGATVSTVDHRFTGTNAADFEVGYSGALANYCHSLALMSVRVSDTERTGTEVILLYSTTERTVTPTATQTTLGIAGVTAIDRVFADLKLASGTTGDVVLYTKNDAGTWTQRGTAQAANGRVFFASGLALSLASTFNMRLGFRSSGGSIANEGYRATGMGFVLSSAGVGVEAAFNRGFN